jgi:hypothetical protein
MYLKDCKSTYDKGTCIPMFFMVPLSMTKLWNQLRCPTTEEQVKQMWYTYTLEFGSAINKNEIMSFARK